MPMVEAPGSVRRSDASEHGATELREHRLLLGRDGARDLGQPARPEEHVPTSAAMTVSVTRAFRIPGV